MEKKREKEREVGGVGVKVIQKGTGAGVGGDAEISFCSLLSEVPFSNSYSLPELTPLSHLGILAPWARGGQVAGPLTSLYVNEGCPGRRPPSLRV